ncbi:dihydroxyacetone kinase [Vibrio aestuarianus]|uniref:dihydroxyacetone kinase subunit DhaK n=1 Tax=Vibrio aestuarianus TaxID=28171 RepID=UPI001559AECE|nr:dihydroxyacetone kinase subunit DhaK [Vibrio aestuarianus]NGZ14733.1 dihydroxyacetone kinase [Vibrio aestuarianus]NKZ50881.1 dihydroxyacetone kinase [Vibrio aestuarianus]
MKGLINCANDVALEQIEGLVASRPELKLNQQPRYVWHELSPNQVALISGGASGHEPMHTGFVGKGMLTGACPGEIFTRVTPDQIYECASKVKTDQGVLFFVQNYVGDIINFKLASELLHADGVNVGYVLIDDDVAVTDSLYTQGRRGGAGTVLLEKIVGAAAQQGYSLTECEALAKRVVNRCRSIAVALQPCTVPASGLPIFTLNPDDVEFGVGIHGEPGLAQIKYTSADDLVDKMFMALKENISYERMLSQWNRKEGSWDEVITRIDDFEPNQDYIAIVNGLGSTPVSQLYIAYKRLLNNCENESYRLSRNMVGNYCTAIDMQGFSLTLLKADAEIIELFDSPVDTAELRW